jgi:hypothetical protein
MTVCPCDERIHPAPLSIVAGLSSLPRQIAGFPEFRGAMLAAVPTVPNGPALRDFRARSEGDFGVMLLEMWAYVCDVIAFYDSAFSSEAYLRTAQQRASLAHLVALIGYQPKPAIAAAVRLGLIADGRRPVVVPAGTAFRSGAFAGSPPQVFETSADVNTYPDVNRFQVVPPRPTTLSGSLTSLLLQSGANVRVGKPLVLVAGDETRVAVVRKVTPSVEPDGARYVRVQIDEIFLWHEHALSDVQALQPSQRAGLWSRSLAAGDPALNDFWGGNDQWDGNTRLLLNGLYRQIGLGVLVVVEMTGSIALARVAQTDEPLVTVAPGATVGSGTSAVTLPAAKVQTTRLWLDTQVPDQRDDNAPSFADPNQVVLHYAFAPAGTVVAAAKPTLGDGDPLALSGVPAAPVGAPEPSDFLLASADQRGLEVPGRLDLQTGLIAPAPTAPRLSPPLELPVTVYANVVAATRGETVAAEVLGSGDSSQANQYFKLQKKPLTYVPSPTSQNDWAAASTLRIQVDGLTWSEVPGFFGAGPEDQVYTVSLDENGAATVWFGDGVRGARLPTGSGNVVASYRFGAGKASPPAFSIRQMVKPVPGLRSVVNPVAAAGGDDTESAKVLRRRAPRSALLLGRAVSILDLQAAAAGVAGVRAAAAEWRWSDDGMRPVVQIWVIGGDGVLPLVVARLRGLSDPSVPISAQVAQPIKVDLAIDLETDPRRNAADVTSAVHSALLDPDQGMLMPEQLGVGGPLFRSVVFHTVLAVPGALSIRHVTWDRGDFSDYGESPGAGKYFDFQSSLTITGSPHG